MYNRYIPKEDGSYSRNRVTEPEVRNEPPPSPPQDFRPKNHTPQSSGSLGSFFRQLLPRQMETADLLILLLLLLMAGEQKEDQGNALLTMALYFIL